MTDDTPDELWYIDRVTAELGYAPGPSGNGAARRRMSRLGVRAHDHHIPPGQTRPRARYRADAVRAAIAAAPGRGTRTDLHREGWA